MWEQSLQAETIPVELILAIAYCMSTLQHITLQQHIYFVVLVGYFTSIEQHVQVHLYYISTFVAAIVPSFLFVHWQPIMIANTHVVKAEKRKVNPLQ